MDTSFLTQYRPGASVLVLAIVALLTVIFRRRYLSPLRDIPGPFLASFSRLWHVAHIFKGDQLTCVNELHKRNGPFVRIAPNEISVSHADAPNKLLLSALEKGPFYNIGAIPDYRYQTTFSTRDPKAKVDRSKNFLPAYALSSILQSEPQIDNVWIKFLDWMDKFAQTGKPMDLDRYLSYATLDVIGEVLFSKPFGFIENGSDIKGAIQGTKAANLIGAGLAYFPWLHFLVANPFVTWLGILPYGLLFDRAVAAVQEREKNSDSRFDMLAFWMKRHKDHPDRVSLKELYAQVALNVGAGGDGVATGLQTFVYHMIRHPNAWTRARDEIRTAQSKGRCEDRVVSYADAQELPYTQACIKEALRVFPGSGMGLPRVAGKGGLTIGTQAFPEGTVLSIHPFTMQLDEALWGPDAREFNPDRWFAKDIAAKEKYWLVFGLGYAACPGSRLAKLQLSKIAATLVRDYDIRQVDPQQSWKFDAYFGAVPFDWPVFVDKVSGGPAVNA